MRVRAISSTFPEGYHAPAGGQAGHHQVQNRGKLPDRAASGRTRWRSGAPVAWSERTREVCTWRQRITVFDEELCDGCGGYAQVNRLFGGAVRRPATAGARPRYPREHRLRASRPHRLRGSRGACGGQRRTARLQGPHRTCGGMASSGRAARAGRLHPRHEAITLGSTRVSVDTPAVRRVGVTPCSHRWFRHTSNFCGRS